MKKNNLFWSAVLVSATILTTLPAQNAKADNNNLAPQLNNNQSVEPATTNIMLLLIPILVLSIPLILKLIQPLPIIAYQLQLLRQRLIIRIIILLPEQLLLLPIPPTLIIRLILLALSVIICRRPAFLVRSRPALLVAGSNTISYLLLQQHKLF